MSHATRRTTVVVLLVAGVMLTAVAPSRAAVVADAGTASVPAGAVGEPPHDPRHVLVTFAATSTAAVRAAAHSAVGGRDVREVGSAGVRVVAVPQGLSPVEAAARYRRLPGVTSAEPNWQVRATIAPNDPRLPDQWGLENTAQPVTGSYPGTADVDIDAVRGWSVAYGDGRYPSTGGVRVGVLDSGIDLMHPDLAGKVVACAGANSGTGLVVPSACADDHGHGTHVAGTIAAIVDNGVGVAGVAPDAQLAVFKALNAPGEGFYSDVIAGIRWLRVTGAARVINMSIGGPASASLDRELAATAAAGVLLVGAAGNEGNDTANYPAYHRDVMSVAAVNSAGGRAGFSNCNADVEIAAPGVDIWSTMLAGRYLRASGTSMAAPHVSGAAAVLMSTRGMSAPAARAALISGVAGSGGCNEVGILNLAGALGSPEPTATTPPAAPSAPDPSPTAAAAEPTPTPTSPAPTTPAPTTPAPAPTTAGPTAAPATPAPTPAPTTPSSTSTPSSPSTPSPTPPGGASPTPEASPSTTAAPTPPSPQADRTVIAGAGFIGLPPARLLDTRTASPEGGRVADRGTRTVQVAGRAGVPSSGVSAVVVNVTAVLPTRSTYLTLFPSGTDRPGSSTVNAVAGRATASLATVRLGGDGAVDVFNFSGSVDVVLDVVGYYTASAGGGSGFGPLAPQRLLDTRAEGGAVDAGSARILRVTGRAGVPAAGVRAVVLNVTVTAPTRPGHVTLHAAGTGTPATSNLNFLAGETRANLAVVALDDSGEVRLVNSAGAAHLVVDVLGWYGDDAASSFGSVVPARLHDTRHVGGPVGGGQVLRIPVAGVAGIPTDARAVVVTLVGTDASATTHLSAHPSGTTPRASTLNLRAGQTVANLAVVTVGDDGAIAVLNSAGAAHIVVDVVGYFRG